MRSATLYTPLPGEHAGVVQRRWGRRRLRTSRRLAAQDAGDAEGRVERSAAASFLRGRRPRWRRGRRAAAGRRAADDGHLQVSGVAHGGSHYRAGAMSRDSQHQHLTCRGRVGTDASVPGAWWKPTVLRHPLSPYPRRPALANKIITRQIEVSTMLKTAY